MPSSPGEIGPLLSLMSRLRDPQRGCPWDVAQDFASIAPFTIEEAYEVADAIERNDFADLRDELGDLLFQIVFHAQMADERGLFCFEDVVDAIVAKMKRRHPHIFGSQSASTPTEVFSNWEALKEAERAEAADASALAGVARTLPALLRADKLQRRAARIGFDWPSATQVQNKLAEELEELATASSPSEVEEEAGDVLFTIVNLVRHYGVEPESALRRASAKFEQRFRAMEQLSGGSLAGAGADELDRLWQAVKAQER